MKRDNDFLSFRGACLLPRAVALFVSLRRIGPDESAPRARTREFSRTP